MRSVVRFACPSRETRRQVRPACHGRGRVVNPALAGTCDARSDRIGRGGPGRRRADRGRRIGVDGSMRRGERRNRLSGNGWAVRWCGAGRSGGAGRARSEPGRSSNTGRAERDWTVTWVRPGESSTWTERNRAEQGGVGPAERIDRAGWGCRSPIGSGSAVAPGWTGAERVGRVGRVGSGRAGRVGRVGWQAGRVAEGRGQAGRAGEVACGAGRSEVGCWANGWRAEQAECGRRGRRDEGGPSARTRTDRARTRTDRARTRTDRAQGGLAPSFAWPSARARGW